MGAIDGAVLNGVIASEPQLQKVLHPFLNDFDISWGAKRAAFNATLYQFIAKPSAIFSETFGLEFELLLIYSPYDSMQARTMQAINSFFQSDPAKGRVENLICIIVSDALNAKDWVNTYATEYQDLRTYVVFNKDELISSGKYSLVPEFRKQLSERDLFDVQLPLLDDLYFFGRQEILHRIQDNIRQCENSGVFGLRKTGKTSLLYKIKRTVESANGGKVFIYDCKNAKIRIRTWNSLLLLILKDLCSAYNLTQPTVDENSPLQVVEELENIIKKIPKTQRAVLIFDEIEYISFLPPLDPHWEKDYFDFWHFLWSMQSTYRTLCFIIAGVNPKVVEISSINSIQNPLFNIVKVSYIQGLTRQDIYDLARRIGRRMGLKFDHTAIDYLHQRYKGHPLLTRLALSFENRNATQKPITFTRDMLFADEVAREEELVPYCQHIVDVLKDFYPDEYMLLEFLSIGAVQDFIDLSTDPMSITHLKNYGLLSYENNMPKIEIPVVASYISRMTAKEQGSQLAHPIIPIGQREKWLSDNIRSIISYMRQLEAVINTNGTPLLFGSNSFPQADKLLEIPVANAESGFKVFISTLSNCFVESIENYGKSIKKSSYFWNEIKSAYPHVFDALLRVKAYRNRSEHLKLIPQMQETVNHFLYLDLEGKPICEVHDSNFILQQCTIENLKVAISVEISNLS